MAMGALRWAGLLLLPACALSLDNGLAATPQMGYNSWYDLMGTINETNIKATADAMVELGLVELGYNYVNLDDCWATGRGSDGKLIADPKLWSGATLKHIADYVHAKGMLFGTYTDRGTRTCGGRPGAQGHEALDAATYASWGVDYLKEDSCNAPGDHATAFKEYGLMRDGLNKTGRPILFSLCGWSAWYAPPDPSLGYGGGKTLGNSFRIGPDDTNWNGVLTNIDINAGLAPYAGPGAWNDPCLLLAETYSGTLRQTTVQTRTQFSMWAVMASPLLISANIRAMSAYNLETYKNKEVIAVNQDSLGQQGIRVAGGPLASSGGGNPPAHTKKCDGSANQQWEFGEAGSEYDEFVTSKGSGLSLNSDDCRTDIILYKAIPNIPANSSSTCCGPPMANNLRFKMHSPAAGMLEMEKCGSMAGMCVTLNSVGHTLTLAKCSTTDKAQQWKFDAAKQTIESASSAAQCMDGGDSAAPTPSPGTTIPAQANVWARNLTGGAIAVVFVNAGKATAAVPCDKACFAAMGLSSGVTHFSARDLWAHTDNGTVSVNQTWTVTVGPSAAAMFKLTPPA